MSENDKKSMDADVAYTKMIMDLIRDELDKIFELVLLDKVLLDKIDSDKHETLDNILENIKNDLKRVRRELLLLINIGAKL